MCSLGFFIAFARCGVLLAKDSLGLGLHFRDFVFYAVI